MPVTDAKIVKNRVHVDLTTSTADRDQEIERLLAPGHAARPSLLADTLDVRVGGAMGGGACAGRGGYWRPVVWPQMPSPSAVASDWYTST